MLGNTPGFAVMSLGVFWGMENTYMTSHRSILVV